MPARTFDIASTRSSLFAAFLSAARRYGFDKPVLEDVERQPLTYGRLLLAAHVLGGQLKTLADEGETVGIMLPNVNGMVVTILGLNAHRRVSALLNFTAGIKNLRSAARTGRLRALVTSRRFVETARLEDVIAALDGVDTGTGRPLSIVYLEDVRRRIGTAAKLGGILQALTSRIDRRRHAARADDTAVILFTSGTEGEPKGVVLSNANLVANARQIGVHAVGALTSDDVVMNPLPMFHSFGLTAATLMPLLEGMKVVLYPSPLHYKQVPQLIRATRASVLFATDTFLQGYARAAEPEDLTSVRWVIAGAERVKESTRKAWREFGTGILEGYGATECSPVISCNLPDAHKAGSVGRLLPGIEARLEPVEGIHDGGRLAVRGPNVMRGYRLASSPDLVVPPLQGWHDTGDIVEIDADGFVTIKGRAKRFAKIGGEMVSLAAVESMVASLWPDMNHVVLALPDARKGEQLVLVTEKPDADRAALLEEARAAGFAELWIPRAVLVVGQIPVLGSGKIDYAATTELARQTRPLL